MSACPSLRIRHWISETKLGFCMPAGPCAQIRDEKRRCRDHHAAAAAAAGIFLSRGLGILVCLVLRPYRSPYYNDCLREHNIAPYVSLNSVSSFCCSGKKTFRFSLFLRPMAFPVVGLISNMSSVHRAAVYSEVLM